MTSDILANFITREEVIAYSKQHPDFVNRLECGYTPLHFIARTPHKYKSWLISALLECGADPTFHDDRCKTPLQSLFYQREILNRNIEEMMDTLKKASLKIQHEVSPSLAKFNSFVNFLGTINDDPHALEKLQALLVENPEIVLQKDIPNKVNLAAVLILGSWNHTDIDTMLDMILKAGVDVNIQNKANHHPLDYVLNGDYAISCVKKIVARLLQSDIEIPENDDFVLKVVKLFIAQKPADASIEAEGIVDVITMLLRANCRISYVPEKAGEMSPVEALLSLTPHTSTTCRIVDLFLSAGLNVNAMYNSDYLAFIVVQHYSKETIKAK